MIGTAVLDFGAHPGKSMASVDVTAQTAIVAGTKVEAFTRLASTADHSVDEHRVETLKIIAGNIVAGDRFTIFGEVMLGRAWGTFNVDWAWV